MLRHISLRDFFSVDMYVAKTSITFSLHRILFVYRRQEAGPYFHNRRPCLQPVEKILSICLLQICKSGYQNIFEHLRLPKMQKLNLDRKAKLCVLAHLWPGLPWNAKWF